MFIFAHHEEFSTSNWSVGGIGRRYCGTTPLYKNSVSFSIKAFVENVGSNPTLTTRMFHPYQIIGMTDGKTSNCLHSSTDRTSGYGLEDVGFESSWRHKKIADSNIEGV